LFFSFLLALLNFAGGGPAMLDLIRVFYFLNLTVLFTILNIEKFPFFKKPLRAFMVLIYSIWWFLSIVLFAAEENGHIKKILQRIAQKCIIK